MITLNEIQNLISQLITNALEELRTRYFLERRAIVKLTFKPETMLHPGMGEEIGVLKVAAVNGKPVILESTWRGALRRIAETLAKASIQNPNPSDLEQLALLLHNEPQGKPLTHIPETIREQLKKPEQATRILTKILEEIAKHKQKQGEREAKYLAHTLGLEALYEEIEQGATPEQVAQEAREEQEALPSILDKLIALSCPICKLFGGPGLRGRIVLEDTILETKIHQRTHVAINRSTKTRREGFLYTAEYILPDEITLTMIVENPKPGSTECKILESTLQYIREIGLTIGGMKTRGTGSLKCVALEKTIERES